MDLLTVAASDQLLAVACLLNILVGDNLVQLKGSRDVASRVM